MTSMRMVIAVTTFGLALVAGRAHAQEISAPDEVQSAAIVAAADWFAISTDRLTVFATEARQWPTPALGCSEPDRAYAQVITPGYLIGVQTDDNSVALVHTDLGGTRTVICEEQP